MHSQSNFYIRCKKSTIYIYIYLYTTEFLYKMQKDYSINIYIYIYYKIKKKKQQNIRIKKLDKWKMACSSTNELLQIIMSRVIN